MARKPTRPKQPLRRARLTQRERRKRWVRRLLAENGLTVTALADHLGLHPSYLNAGLYDRRPALAEAHRRTIARLLGEDIYASYLPPEPVTEEDAHAQPA